MALTRTEKLIEFAKDGQKSIQGLTLLLGFPRDEKPARDWFNYLFNKTFYSINSLIDEIEELRKSIEFLKVKDDFDVTAPEVVPPVVSNPTGAWILKTAPEKLSGNQREAIIYMFLEHSSGMKVGGITVSTTSIRASDGLRIATWSNSVPVETNNLGILGAPVIIRNGPDSHPTIEVKITAPDTTDFIQTFNIWDGTPYVNGSGYGGNANQTE